MRIPRRAALIALATLSALTIANAAGMGDPSYILKEKNAICDAQRRGEGPLTPNLCLPELPAAPVQAPRREHR